MHCFFASDLHGKTDRYQKLFQLIENEKPDAVFLAGDLLPSGLFAMTGKQQIVKDFTNEFLIRNFELLKEKLGEKYPAVFVILGNDDGKTEEHDFIKASKNRIWYYLNSQFVDFEQYTIYGYAYVPPTPFQLKDWEKYDVSRFVDPGCVAPEEGVHSFPVKIDDVVYSTIQQDLEDMTKNKDISKSIFLFHSPPYQTNLDRAALDGKMIEYVPLDVNIGSIAIKRFIEEKQPFLTLHGHVHESTRLTGNWQDNIGKTISYQAAHDGKELSLIRFNPEVLSNSKRDLY